jgi:hypothetical protein
MTATTIRERCELCVDESAGRWLDERPEVSSLFVAYMSSRACCSSAKVCDVRVRVDADSSRRSSRAVRWAPLGRVRGRDVFIDSRLVDRMPARAHLRVRGVGRFRHLDLDLTGEQWAELLYPVPR